MEKTQSINSELCPYSEIRNAGPNTIEPAYSQAEVAKPLQTCVG